jgi:hypothetical protein
MIRQNGRRRLFVWVACVVCLAQLAARGWATDLEQRDFSIMVDGKEAGQSRLTITVADDGAIVVTANAKVKFSQLLFTYNYNVESTEWWKDGKLIGLKSNTVENGKHTEVTAAAAGTQLKIRVNGQDRLGSADDWSSSFWKLADARYHNKPVHIIETDSGKEFMGQLQYIGTEQLTLQSQPQACYHFRVSGGGYPIDVWFDRYHRLARQEFIDSGHKTILQLTAVKR